MRAARDRMPADVRAAASHEVTARLVALAELSGARRIAGYAATANEVDLDGWLRQRLAAGADVFLPWVDGADLRLGRVRDLGDDLAPGWRGLREPRHPVGSGGADPARMDAAVVPGLAFDRSGRRLGQGGGHIDRLLARLRPAATVVGVVFSAHLVDDGMIPIAPHDMPVDIVVTDAGVWRGGRSARLQALERSAYLP